MVLSCPHCSARYELPERLLGPGGARVRCPRCHGSFTVDADGAVHAAAEEPAAATDAIPPLEPEPAVPAAEPRGGAAEERVAGGFEGAARAPAASGHAPTEAPAEHLRPDARALAREVLDAFVERGGPALEEARGRGRLFSEFGPALFEAFEEYLRRAPAPDPALFREAIRERLGVELTPPGGEDHPRPAVPGRS
jgi:predicted Zn finger-like uncharacterized protein